MLSIAKWLGFVLKAFFFPSVVIFNRPVWEVLEDQGLIFFPFMKLLKWIVSHYSATLKGLSFFSRQWVGVRCIAVPGTDTSPTTWMAGEVTRTAQGQEAHTLNKHVTTVDSQINNPLLQFYFLIFSPAILKETVLWRVFSANTNIASCLFYQVREEQVRSFHLDIHWWFSDDLCYTCVRIS